MRNLFLAIFVPCLPLSFQYDCEILHTRLSTVQVCYVQLNLSMLDVFDNCLCCNIKVLVLDSVQVCFSDRSLTTQDARDCPHPGWSVRQPDRSQVLGGHQVGWSSPGKLRNTSFALWEMIYHRRWRQ